VAAPHPALGDVAAYVFDAYGTLFDVAAGVRACAAEIGPQALELAELWGLKQLQYTWLRTLMGSHADFWQVTGEALDYSLAVLRLTQTAPRERLMALYRALAPYPEVPGVLARLRTAHIPLAILSNGAPEMLRTAAASAGIAAQIDAVLSVEAVGVYKTHPAVYRLGPERFGVPAARLAFFSANGWDAAAAAAFGYQAVWINRRGQPAEVLPGQPVATIATLAEAPALFGLE